MAYVQTSVLLDQAPGRAEAEAQFDKETGTYREQIKRMSDSLNAMVADFQKRQATLAAAARETQAKGIQAKEAGVSAPHAGARAEGAGAAERARAADPRQDQAGDRGGARRGRLRDDLQRRSGLADRRGGQEPQRHGSRAVQAEGHDGVGAGARSAVRCPRPPA